MSRRDKLEQLGRKKEKYEFQTSRKQYIIDKNQFELHRGSFGGLFPVTQKKNRQYDFTSNDYMDKLSTPIKYQSIVQSSYSINPLQISQTSKNRQVLRKLDQTQQKLVISEKKYGQLWRKYQNSCQNIRTLNNQLIKKRSHQNQGSPSSSDLKIKIDILQRENKHSNEQIKLKNSQIQNQKNTLNLMKEKFAKLQEKTDQKQKEIQQLFQQRQDHRKIIENVENEIFFAKQQKQRSFERIINTLKGEIQSLHSQLTNKTHEIIVLKQNIHVSSPSYNVVTQDSTLQAEVNSLHKQKINLIGFYEQKLSSLQQQYQFELQKTNLAIKQEMQKQLHKIVQIKLTRQQSQADNLIEMNKMKDSLMKLRTENRQLQKRVSNLSIDKNNLQSQLSLMLAQSKAYQKQSSIYSSQNSNQLVNMFQQLQSIKRQISNLKYQLETKNRQIKDQRQKNHLLAQQIKRFQQELKEINTHQFQNNKKIQNTSKSLLDRINSLQQQNQQMQRQLLTERLQSASLKHSLQSQQIQLKRQYQLSLQNVKAQLSRKIKVVKEEKSLEIAEKQQIYLQLRQIQRKYELLVSQMLTVNDMMAIATRVHKRHSKFVKGQKKD